MGSLVMPMADIGPASPLAPLHPIKELHASGVLGDDIPDSIRENTRLGRVDSILPYHRHDDYGRDRTSRSLPVAILENDHLRATFLPSLGGRLWSIVDKRTGRDLLYQNPVIQPANLGLGNAWFSGGVEWNISTIGHSPLSSEPFHAARVDGPEGVPVLRLYGFERLRETPFMIDAYLPVDSKVLFLGMRIRNPNPVTVPVYWWSNIAVAEAPGVRVLAPAEDAFRFDYDGGLKRVAMPVVGGVDASYPANGPASIDFFFDVPAGRRPWIAAVDALGRGLLQCSTRRLRGRKLFIWGQGPGGQRWQSFLSQPGHPYVEIQAGLAQTQLEHLPMPPDTEWTWVEAYAPFDLDAATAHGPWDVALRSADDALEAIVPEQYLDAMERRLTAQASVSAAEVLQVGTGWGALEDRRRRSSGEAALSTQATPFPAISLGPDQAPWLRLLQSGSLPEVAPSAEPPASVVGPSWAQHLRAAPETWLSNYLEGVVAMAGGDRAEARVAWERSLARDDNPWAARGLAVIDMSEGDASSAAHRLERANELRPDVRGLLVELLEALVAAGRADDALERIEALAGHGRTDGRIRLIEIQAALAVGDLDRALGIFRSGLVVPDLREGDTSLEDHWFELQARRIALAEERPLDETVRDRARREHPVPAEYDFRMGRAR